MRGTCRQRWPAHRMLQVATASGATCAPRRACGRHIRRRHRARCASTGTSPNAVVCGSAVSRAISAQADAFDLRCGAGEILLHEVELQTNSVEDLRAAIGLVGRDAHLGHHLQQSLADSLDVALQGFLRASASRRAPGMICSQRLEGEVGVDRLRAVAGEHRELMHLARFARSRRPGRPWCAGLAGSGDDARPTVASSEGIGIRSGPTARSDRMMML